MIGARAIALSRFVYQESRSALPFTTFRLCLMTTECMAVIMDEVTPKKMPLGDTGVPSRNTPMKKPSVTIPHEASTLSDGREWRTTQEVTTVKGRTRPRATW